MIDIAEPINIVLIVNIIGATAFLDKAENIKHNIDTVIITGNEINADKTNLKATSSSPKNSRPLWYTAKSPESNMTNEKKSVYKKKKQCINIVDKITYNNFDVKTKLLDGGLVK